MLKSEVLELVPQLCLFSVAEVSGGDIEALKVPLVSFSATVEWLMVFSGTKMVEGDVIVTSEMPERLMFSGLLCSPEVKVLVLLMLVESVVPVGLEFSGVMWVLPLPPLTQDCPFWKCPVIQNYLSFSLLKVPLLRISIKFRSST